MDRQLTFVAMMVACTSLASPASAQTVIDTRTGTSRLDRSEQALFARSDPRAPQGLGHLFAVSDFRRLTSVSVYLLGVSSLPAQPFHMFLRPCDAQPLAVSFDCSIPDWISDVRLSPTVDGIVEYRFDIAFPLILFPSSFSFRSYLLEFQNFGTEPIFFETIARVSPDPFSDPLEDGALALGEAPSPEHSLTWVRDAGRDLSVVMHFADPSVSTVPEPASIALIATGLAALGGGAAARRKRHG